MIKQIVGGTIAVIIGGSAYSFSQKDVVNNMSNNTGMTQQEAQQYINNIPKSDLASFSTVGQSFIDDGNTAISALSGIDCENYTYQWETPTLDCTTGKNQFQQVGNDEIILGNCYKSLDTDLGSSASPIINKCISDIDIVDTDLTLPIVTALLDSSKVNDALKTNAYNKSILQAALNSK